jgi:protein ImuB
MRRVVSVWLPDWPITVWRRSRIAQTRSTPPEQDVPDKDKPFALVDRTGRGVILHALNRAARAHGLRRGQSHADARAICPGLISMPAEPLEEARALEALALWFERFSPAVSMDPTPAFEGLFLDMTGAAHLFGGETALLRQILTRLRAAGVRAQVALADTYGAAWALARYANQPLSLAPQGGTRDAIADLPVEALRLDEASVRLLARFGLQRIGDLYPLPRSGLARRFGAKTGGQEGIELVRRLDQALGVESEPLKPQRPPPDYRTWQVFAEPLIEMQGVAFALPALAEALAAQLEQDGQGARMLALDAFRTDGRVVRLTAGLSAPSRAPKHLLRLLKEKGLEHLDLGFGADALMLTALAAEPLSAAQGELEGDIQLVGAQQAPLLLGKLADLIDRLEAKLGEGAVRRPQGVESHLPERSERWIPAGPRAPVSPEAADPGRPRPLLMFDPPEPVTAIAKLPDSAPSQFTWRRAAHRVAKAQGPERLSPEWWRRTPAEAAMQGPWRTRDYYAVEDDAGRRFWLFRDGLYDRDERRFENEAGAEKAGDAPLPQWWIQGVWG